MKGHRQIEHDAAAWLARRDGGAWSENDDAALDAWLADATAHRVAFLRLEAAWKESDRLQVLVAGRTPGAAASAQWPRAVRDDDVAMAAPPLRRASWRARSHVRRWAAAAAAACLAVALVVGWHRYDPVEATAYRTVVGALQTVTLADGSNTTLSSDTAVEVSLSRRERHVELTRGEAYFEVAKDPDRPFAVDVGGRRVVAVGTRFAVRRDGDEVRVVVTEGTVRLESEPIDGNRQPVTLLPAGSVALANRNGVVVRAGPVADAEQVVDWRRGYLVFRDTPLATAAAEFNRYNTRPIVIADSAAATQRIGGSFRWSNAEVFVNLVEQAVPVKAEREAERIVVRSR